MNVTVPAELIVALAALVFVAYISAKLDSVVVNPEAVVFIALSVFPELVFLAVNIESEPVTKSAPVPDV